MANQKHVDRLLEGVEVWNQWREESLLLNPDLSDADLNGADFSGANLSDANLRNADLRHTSFDYADFSDADLSGANLGGANLSGAYFSRANLIFADLDDADLSGVDFSRADLSDASLRNTDLICADFSDANLNRADFCDANLSAAQALQTSFQTATLTGTCIEDWNINSRTNLQDVICEYIFTRYDYTKGQFIDRRPHDPKQIFAPGEFSKRYQIVLETVDLFFNDGIDWKAFLASLQDLKTEYGEDLNLQGIEKKSGGSFLVRLEVPSDADKGAIERTAKDRYETHLQILEAKYHAELQAKDREIEIYKQKSADILELAKLAASRPITVENTNQVMVEQQSNAENYNTTVHGNVGNLANKMQDQSSQQTNQYIGANLNEIASLIHSLRGMAESFPEAQRTEVLEHLEDLETDIQQPPEKRKLSRMKAALLALVGTATVVSGAVAGANEFVGQVQELSDKLNIPLPIEQIEPQP